MNVVEVFMYHRYWDFSDYVIPKVKIKHGKLKSLKN